MFYFKQSLIDGKSKQLQCESYSASATAWPCHFFAISVAVDTGYSDQPMVHTDVWPGCDATCYFSQPIKCKLFGRFCTGLIQGYFQAPSLFAHHPHCLNLWTFCNALSHLANLSHLYRTFLISSNMATITILFLSTKNYTLLGFTCPPAHFSHLGISLLNTAATWP